MTLAREANSIIFSNFCVTQQNALLFLVIFRKGIWAKLKIMPSILGKFTKSRKKLTYLRFQLFISVECIFITTSFYFSSRLKNEIDGICEKLIQNLNGMASCTYTSQVQKIAVATVAAGALAVTGHTTLAAVAAATGVGFGIKQFTSDGSK